MFEKEKPFDKVWGAGTACFVVAIIAIIAALLFRIGMFVFPTSWVFWYGLCKVLNVICLWVFRIAVPLAIVLCIIAFIGNLVYRLKNKE